MNSLTANFAEFRAVTFQDGLNIVVADRAKESTKTDSRNGLGKTTVIALIDFCLGANMSARLEQMKGNEWYFTLSFTTRAGITLSVSRGPDSPGEVHIEGDVVTAGIVLREGANLDETTTIGSRQWTNWLGQECFVREGMPAAPPSFRSLVRHFARYRTDSLIDPFRTLANQRAEAVQAENAYLLNLDWRFAKEWSELKERKARVALADDPDNTIDARIAALEPQLVRLKRRADSLTEDIRTFSVLPEYRKIESRVQEATSRIKSLANQNFTDRQQLALYESQVRDEFTTSNISVQRLFAEAGMVLGDAIIRSLDEAAEFQRQVAANRASYLEDEARRIRERIAQREAEQAENAARQEQDMRLLRSGGALDDFAALQKRLAESQVQVAQVEEQIRTLRELGDRKSKLKSLELDLVTRTKLDLQERFELRSGVIARFGEIMESLYGEPADLRVSPGRGGIQFKVVLPKTGSGGVHLMAIFAYDVALAEDLAARGRGPGFLLHDSAIFADVDERQTAKAIEVASASASEFGYQHLLTMNSDNVPWEEFSVRSVFSDSVVLTLHDGDPSGSVLGTRLSPSDESE
ncbi:DUF2326 domain-containing protein [Arthrobacter zhangbolii]|uniref:DUF2326 domain-containing protein n=1 Tax=Arthrobacter zhangbolii TaxID=2886936 RepID=A0A9X1MAY1_9MICC|nr:DUF2326 domain-containing protein [Arthrobacter zhangbolii]MCC3273499.1 DUF2326 domain-containing protein [Arthrobacter zhangbolii]UON92312.1 DUF2326 domain-containing protein [Arthrobacter zhangbolii]